MSDPIFWARKEQTLWEHIVDMLKFAQKYYIGTKELNTTAKRLELNPEELKEALFVTIIFHDVGKIFLHYEKDQPPKSFIGHEVISSYVLNVVCEDYSIKAYEHREYERVEDKREWLKYAVHFSIQAHHAAMGESRKYQLYRSPEKIPDVIANFKKRILTPGEALKIFIDKVNSEFPISGISIDFNKLNDIERLKKEYDPLSFINTLDAAYKVTQRKSLYFISSTIATRITAILMLADYHSASRGKIAGRKMFKDFDL